MADFGSDGRDLSLDFMTGKAVSAPAGLFIKLHIGDPGVDGTLNAAAETARQSVAFGVASSGQAVSSADVTWLAVTASETYSHVSIWSASTAGDVEYQGAMTAPVAVVACGTFKFLAGDAVINHS